MSFHKPRMSEIFDEIKNLTQQSEKNCKTCGHKHCLFFNENQNPVYKHCWFAPENTFEQDIQMPTINKIRDYTLEQSIPIGQMFVVSGNPNKDQTQIPSISNMTTGNIFEHRVISGLMELRPGIYDSSYNRIVDIEDLVEQERLEKCLKTNEKILRKHPARKDLFLQNMELRKQIKRIKEKAK